jgi:hypothetical protein
VKHHAAGVRRHAIILRIRVRICVCVCGAARAAGVLPLLRRRSSADAACTVRRNDGRHAGVLPRAEVERGGASLSSGGGGIVAHRSCGAARAAARRRRAARTCPQQPALGSGRAWVLARLQI